MEGGHELDEVAPFVGEDYGAAGGIRGGGRETGW